METPTTKSVKTTIIHWLPVVLFMITASLIRLHSNAAVNYYLLAGSDGPYYPLQVRSMLEHFHLAMPDMPLLFIVDGLLAKILQIFHIASPDECILLSIRFTNSFLPPLAGIPVFLIAEEFKTKPSLKASFLNYLIVAFLILNFTPVVLFSNSVLQKNAIAVIWIFFYLYFVLRALKYGRKKDVYYGLLTLLLCALTHYGSFALLALFSVLTGVFWLVSHKGYSGSVVQRKIAVVRGGVLFILCLIAILDFHRFERLLFAPLNLFRGPVLFFALKGQQMVLAGYTLINLIIINLLALFALILIFVYRRQIKRSEKIFALSLAALSFTLSSPLYGPEYANRLFMMSYIPTSVLFLFIFNEVRSGWIKVIPVLLLTCLTLFSIGTGVFDRRVVSITDNAFSEFKQINRAVPFTPQSVIIARQDLRLLGSWVFRTKESADYLFTDGDFDKYDAVYIIKQVDGNNLRAARYRQPDTPLHSLLVFKGDFFEVYKISKGLGWNSGWGKLLRVSGPITDIRGDRLILSAGQDGNTQTVECSKNTIINLRQRGGKLTIGMYIEVWGNWEPFSLTVDAAAISEVMPRS
jgi:hypothetical protein